MKVLISCDYNQAGEFVLHEAHRFLVAFPNAEVHVFSVIDMAIVSAAGMYSNTELLSSLEMDAEELGKKAKSIFEGKQITFSTEVGFPAATVLNKAASLAADLLILGTHGRTGLQRLVIGSVAENILRQSPCNTLVIPVKHTGDERNTVK